MYVITSDVYNSSESVFTKPRKRVTWSKKPLYNYSFSNYGLTWSMSVHAQTLNE